VYILILVVEKIFLRVLCLQYEYWLIDWLTDWCGNFRLDEISRDSSPSVVTIHFIMNQRFSASPHGVKWSNIGLRVSESALNIKHDKTVELFELYTCTYAGMMYWGCWDLIACVAGRLSTGFSGQPSPLRGANVAKPGFNTAVGGTRFAGTSSASYFEHGFILSRATRHRWRVAGLPLIGRLGTL